MTKQTLFAISLSFALLLSACSGNGQQTDSQSQSEDQQAASSAMSNQPETGSTEAGAEDVDPDSGVLIAYFSMPEDVDTADADAVSGASIVVRDGETLGNVQYMAQIIQENTGGDLFRIETVQQYPLDHDPLVNQADEEQADNARPELKALPENLDDYDTIFLGYPNWWGDMPMPLYAFLESVDLSGKTIIPFCPHGGSGFSRTESTIAELQPDATVSEDGLAISRNDVAGAEGEIVSWLQGLGLTR